MYSAQFIEYYRDMQHLGELDDSLSNVGLGMTQSPCCGMIALFLQADTDETICDIKYKITGKPAFVASASYVASFCKGKTLTEAFQLNEQSIARALDLNYKQVREASVVLRGFRNAIAAVQAKIRHNA